MSEDEYREITARVHGLFPGLRRRGIYDIVVKEKGNGDQPHSECSRQGRQSLVPKEAAERAFQGPAAPSEGQGKGKERVHELQTARQREREIGELLDMFPALPRYRLEEAYDAHGQHLQPTVDHLLTATADNNIDNNNRSADRVPVKGNDGEDDDEEEDEEDEDDDDDDDDGDEEDDEEEEEGLKFRCMEYMRERWGQYADQLHRLTPEVARELQDHVRAYGVPGAHARAPVIEPVALSPEEERARDDLNSVFLFALTSTTTSDSPSPTSSPSSLSSSSSSSSSSLERYDHLRLSSEGVAASAGWMAEWEEMERRDEEVARALQREEHERAADIERKDEQLAHLIAVQERRQEALRRRRRQEQTNAAAAADEARRRREADDAEYARTLQEQFDAEKKGDTEVKRMMELMEEEDASMSLIRQLLGHERQFRGHHQAEDLMKHSDVQLCETLFAGDIREFLTEDTRQVTDIKRVLQLELVRRFMAKWLELKRTYGSYAEEARPRLGFHGTPEANIPSIVKQGLLVPGAHGVINRTDDGYYGAGIYLSPDARTSLGYAGGCGKLLVCAVLMGRIYKCEDLMHGAPCTPGFDSHMSPCEGELILFEAAQVLPCFVITIASAVRRPMPAPALPSQSTTHHLTAKRAAKAKGGRTPKATAKLKRQRKLARRAQRAAKGGRKNQ